MSILIIADRHDVHADLVGSKLVDAGMPVCRLDLDMKSLESTNLTFLPEGDIAFTSKIGDWTLSEVSVIYGRKLFIEKPVHDPDATTSVEEVIWSSSWRSAIFNLLATADERGIPTFPRYREAIRAEIKTYQRAAAERAGLSVPRSIVSNSHQELIEFFNSCSRCVIKPLFQDFFIEGDKRKGIYVNLIEAEDLDQLTDPGHHPIMLQEYIEKSFEVRITSVGGQHFACRIDSQSSEIANIDWRKYDYPNTPHTAIEIPGDVSIQLDSVLSDLNLDFGASDFIVDEEGQWWFLEVNPNGQWLWIEELAGLDISSAIVDLLIQRSSGDNSVG